jgi:hypothetical protein
MRRTAQGAAPPTLWGALAACACRGPRAARPERAPRRAGQGAAGGPAHPGDPQPRRGVRGVVPHARLPHGRQRARRQRRPGQRQALTGAQPGAPCCQRLRIRPVRQHRAPAVMATRPPPTAPRPVASTGGTQWWGSRVAYPHAPWGESTWRDVVHAPWDCIVRQRCRGWWGAMDAAGQLDSVCGSVVSGWRR